ncbi:MAG: YfcL family protein [Gammaproteobacteria bacterium]|nr:YfcL family protein [Gammaproteobacteria bacterium]MBU2057061.1 YfcL family protein [Gammaproteobacteria bacterium]MBU2175120.1 YfcL family protein [Gammaproteobacteria bacterium]MBU2245151.1 YfcL family protein [Gammaproteobacteria bacterium]MBU2343982.1 YfcL family protein [Gammaproteobacteria bacterium]
MQNVQAYIQQVAQFLDAMVQHASDDELFAGGYLRGHFDLAVGRLELTEQQFERATLADTVQHSLDLAIAGGELTEQDQSLVLGLWQQLQQLS